jgi:ribosomal-protein-alanine N-acetyltransferase
MAGGTKTRSLKSPSTSSMPGSRYLITPATWRDLGALRTLEQICFPKDVWPIWDLIGVLTLPNMVRLKALAEREMVGFIAADCRLREGVAWIATVGVLPGYRRMGIGRALMEQCENEISLDVIRLCVRVSNQAAQEMYRVLGYGVKEIWAGYYQDGEDALVMEKIRRLERKGL